MKTRFWNESPRGAILILELFVMQSPTYYKDNAESANYSFVEFPEYIIRDNPSGLEFPEFEGDAKPFQLFEAQISNSIVPAKILMPHLILNDYWAVPRFVLGHELYKDNIIINYIQRVRTQYSILEKDGNQKYLWDSKLELKASKEFQERLGMHPSEFILSEFLFRHKPELEEKLSQSRTPLYLSRCHHRTCKIYDSLIDRFFSKKLAHLGFPLNVGKKRVKAILELS